MRARWAAASAVLVAAMLLGSAGAVSATNPVQLGSTYVLDDAEALTSSEEAAADARLTDLFESTGVDLWVVYVPEFTNPSDAFGWANAVAGSNGLTAKQYLLAVSTEGRQYTISSDVDGPLSGDQLETIETALRTPLGDDDWAGAVTVAADGFEAALGGSGSASAGSLFTGILWFVVIALAIFFVVWLVIRSRRKKAGATGGNGTADAPQISTKELALRASQALIETDDAIKTSEEELGFAKAQFGDAATAEFETVIAQAKAGLNQAFTLKQQLDDSTADSEEQTRAWNTQIIELCDAAGVALDEKAAAFDELRKLEQNAPEALARVQEARVVAAGAVDAAAALLASLSQSYAPEALVTIADNPDQARSRIAFADAQLVEAQNDIGSGRGGEAAVSIRAAEEAIGQATHLEDAITTLARDLADGEQQAQAIIAELESDLATAATLPDPDGRLAGVIASTQAQVTQAKTNLAGTSKRPLFTLQNLEAADQQIDALIAGVRDAAAKQERAQQMLGQTILQAQAQVSTAEDYITSRRGAIGAEARTRLAEAGASLVQAKQLQASDAQQSLTYAQRANQLASQAIQYAQQDVGSFQNQSGMLGGGSGGGGGNNVLGAVLGGIVLNSMMGGGGGRSSRSSGSRSTGGLFGGGGRSSGGRSAGGRSSGSFGGGGTRTRRGGGRF